MKISVATIEDDPIVQSFLEQLLNNSDKCTHVGTANNKHEAIDLINANKADVYLVDINLPDINGIELIRYIRKIPSAAVCLVLSSVTDREKIIESVQAGANGYLLKDEHPDDLVKKIVDAHQGRAPMSPKVANVLIQAVANQPPTFTHSGETSNTSFSIGISNLTRREFEILKKLATTEPVKTIAAELHISPFTVNQHILHIYRKLGVKTRMAAVIKAHEYKIL